MHQRSGFLLFEMVLYAAIAASCTVFFIKTVRSFLEWRVESKELFGLLLTHHHALMVLTKDIAACSSHKRSESGWSLCGQKIDKNGESCRWEVLYELRKRGLYRKKKTFIAGDVIQSVVRLGPAPLGIDIAEEAPGCCDINYEIKKGISCQKKVAH